MEIPEFSFSLLKFIDIIPKNCFIYSSPIISNKVDYSYLSFKQIHQPFRF